MAKVKKITKEESDNSSNFEMVLTRKKNLMEIGLRKGQLRQGNKFLVQTKDKEFVEVFLFDICTPIGEEDIFVWHRHMTKEEFDKIREKPVKKTG